MSKENNRGKGKLDSEHTLGKKVKAVSSGQYVTVPWVPSHPSEVVYTCNQSWDVRNRAMSLRYAQGTQAQKVPRKPRFMDNCHRRCCEILLCTRKEVTVCYADQRGLLQYTSLLWQPIGRQKTARKEEKMSGNSEKNYQCSPANNNCSDMLIKKYDIVPTPSMLC